jgi:capsular exopolysaccharide synthesis family protein
VAGLDQDASDPRDLLRILRRRGWILLLCVALVPAAVFSYSARLDDVFQSKALIQAQATGDAGTVIGQNLSPPSDQTTAAVARLALTTAVADEAARVLRRRLGSVALAGTSVDENTGFITLTADGPTPRDAAQIANAFAAALGTTRQRRAERTIDQTRTDLRTRLSQTRDPLARREIVDQLSRLNTLRRAQGENVDVIEAALPGVHVSPHPARNAMLGVIGGALLGLGLMLLAERWDRTLRKPDELATAGNGVPLLASIPKDAFPGRRPNPHSGGAFQTLRDSLTYFNVDRDLTSIAITSPLKGDGKTTVAINLALSLVQAGHSVILIDADLRDPQVARRLGFDNSTGLARVLTNSAALSEALFTHESGLRVLPAGPTPPNPSELIGSQRMRTLLAELQEQADIVVLDTTPILVVSDAFPLLDQVSGVVALAKVNQTPRPAIRRMLEIIASAGGEARVLGLVATGTDRADAYAYGYGYGYGRPGQKVS